MMGVDVVRAAANEAINILDAQTCVIEGVLDRLQKQVAGANLRHPPEPAVADTDDGTTIPKPLRLHSHILIRISGHSVSLQTECPLVLNAMRNSRHRESTR